MRERRREDRFDRETRRLENEGKRRRRRLVRRLAFGSALAGLAAFNVLLYTKIVIPRIKAFSSSWPQDTPVMLIDRALQRYSREHGGAVPQGLGELVGSYLRIEELRQVDLDDVSYTRTSDGSYELRMKPDRSGTSLGSAESGRRRDHQ